MDRAVAVVLFSVLIRSVHALSCIVIAFDKRLRPALPLCALIIKLVIGRNV